MTMRLVALTALLALAACSPEPADETLTADTVKPFEVQDNAETKRVVENGDTSIAPTFALNADGLVVTHGTAKGRPVTLLQFGDEQAKTIEGLTGELGQPKESDNAECGAGPMHFADFGALKASFQDDKFVGWVAEAGKGLKTGDGISPDKPFRFLERIGARLVPKSTLDGEFVLEGSGTGSNLGGIVEDGEKVRMLFAGSNCFFR